MSKETDQPLFSGRPMELDALEPDALLPYPLPEDARVVTIDEARASLTIAGRVLVTLQAMSDEAHDLTDELEVLLEHMDMTHPHVLEVAEQLGNSAVVLDKFYNKAQATSLASAFVGLANDVKFKSNKKDKKEVVEAMKQLLKDFED